MCSGVLESPLALGVSPGGAGSSLRSLPSQPTLGSQEFFPAPPFLPKEQLLLQPLLSPPPSPNPLLPFASPTSTVARGGNKTLWIFGINTSQADSATLFFYTKTPASASTLAQRVLKRVTRSKSFASLHIFHCEGPPSQSTGLSILLWAAEFLIFPEMKGK